MRKALLFLVILCICRGISPAKKIASFDDDFFKRPIVRLDDKKIYIIDQGLLKVLIYNKSDMKKIAEFGRQGEGPQEFTGIANAAIDQQNIYISTLPKLCIFTKEGKFVKEIKSQSRTGNILPLGNNFAGICFMSTNIQNDILKYQVRLFDGNLQNAKDLLYTEIHCLWKFEKSKRVIYWIRDCVDIFSYKDRLYAGTTGKGFFFSVFDAAGKHLYDIKKPDKKRRITDEEKRFYLKAIRLSMGEEKWNEYNASYEVAFVDYYPEYQSFFVNDDRIYVFHFRDMKLNTEVSILDLKGNLLKTKVVEIMDLEDVSSKYHYVYGGKLYRMQENVFNWELHEIDLLN